MGASTRHGMTPNEAGGANHVGEFIRRYSPLQVRHFILPTSRFLRPGRYHLGTARCPRLLRNLLPQQRGGLV